MADGPSGRFEIGRVLTDIVRILRGGWQPIWPVLLTTMLAPPVVLAGVQLALRQGMFSNPAIADATFSGLPPTALGIA